MRCGETIRCVQLLFCNSKFRVLLFSVRSGRARFWSQVRTSRFWCSKSCYESFGGSLALALDSILAPRVDNRPRNHRNPHFLSFQKVYSAVDLRPNRGGASPVIAKADITRCLRDFVELYKVSNHRVFRARVIARGNIVVSLGHFSLGVSHGFNLGILC